MNVYTHNTADDYRPCTFVKFAVSAAPLCDLGLGDDWFQVDPQEVADTEELCECGYIETMNVTQLRMQRTEGGEPVRFYGRM